MRVFTCTDHCGHYVGVASVIVAEDEEHAARLLAVELPNHGLDPSAPFSLKELDLTAPAAIVLQDGDY